MQSRDPLGEAPAHIQAVARKGPKTPTGRTGIIELRFCPRRLRAISTVCCAKAWTSWGRHCLPVR
ncbi:MAG TPA: hypothetical protein ENH54_01840 [Actinobacteria bacterium]|nr:hypothetical protein [Actinomycetota bacterium]